jgi:hypothetical protein
VSLVARNFFNFFLGTKSSDPHKTFFGRRHESFFLGTFSEKKIVLASGQDCRGEGERGTKREREKISKKFHRTCGCTVSSRHYRTCGARAVPCGIPDYSLPVSVSLLPLPQTPPSMYVVVRDHNDTKVHDHRVLIPIRHNLSTYDTCSLIRHSLSTL